MYFDRVAKKRLYARNGIPEFWILDLKTGLLEVYREPHGEDFAVLESYGKTGAVNPLGAPNAVIQVADLLP
ncbi:MAG: Uma2 family endonuclease [Thiohalocapsa sp.]|uniref:Uma2 family endonuclease n=1 Tax=Thiohalocapsa sp. TaxID=2497641 RepID=UPI00345C1254|nr:Uma2 family endonuclease [Thiohalocapsa sp.]